MYYTCNRRIICYICIHIILYRYGLYSYFKDYIVYFKIEVSSLLETRFWRFISNIKFLKIEIQPYGKLLSQLSEIFSTCACLSSFLSFRLSLQVKVFGMTTLPLLSDLILLAR